MLIRVGGPEYSKTKPAPGEPSKPAHGEPSKPAHGEPSKPAHGDPSKPAPGDPSKPEHGLFDAMNSRNLYDQFSKAPLQLEIEMSKNRFTTIANFGNLFIDEILSEIMASKPNLLCRTTRP